MKKGRRKRRRYKPKHRKFSLEEKKRYADKLRKRMTPAESKLWSKLKQRQRGTVIQFEAQQVICGYIPDFVERELKLIVEVDGPIDQRNRLRDMIRQNNLESNGFQVVRFLNRQVLEACDTVVQAIFEHVPQELLERTPMSSEDRMPE